MGRQGGLAAGLAQRTLGLTRLDQNDLGAAGECLAEALATFSAIDARYFVARTRTDLAEVAIRRQERHSARTLLSEARWMFQTMDVSNHVHRVERLAVSAGVALESDPASGT